MVNALGGGSYGSDVVVETLRSLGVDTIAFNPGASFRGLHDSWVEARDVSLLECLHEEISVAIAHGYAKATGGVMAAALHDIVGLQHATMAIFNAWCDRVPVLLLGATGPMDAVRRRPWIDWIHTANVQATQVRDYTKWDDQPTSVEAIPESLIRAHHLAVTGPKGPVYVCLDTALQEQAVDEHAAPPRDGRRYALPRAPHASCDDVEAIAARLCGARAPVVLADYVGRDPAAFDGLVALAELLAVPVVDMERDYNKPSLNFPTSHPLNVSACSPELVGECDVVLGLELRDPFGSLHELDHSGRSAARSSRLTWFGHVSMSHLGVRAWSADFQRLAPEDLRVTAGLAATVAGVLEAARRAVDGDHELRDRVERRRARVTDATARTRRRHEREAAAATDDGGIPWSAMAAVAGDALEQYECVVANGHLGNWLHRLWDLRSPDQYLGDAGGGGLGYGLGAAVGAAFAHRNDDRLVIDFQSDGDALYTPQALWTLAHHDIPLLVVMDNNRAYQNSAEHARAIAQQRRRPAGSTHIGTAIDRPAVDFPALARSFGVEAVGSVRRLDELGPALERAAKVVVERRRPVLVDVVTQPRIR